MVLGLPTKLGSFRLMVLFISRPSGGSSTFFSAGNTSVYSSNAVSGTATVVDAEKTFPELSLANLCRCGAN